MPSGCHPYHPMKCAYACTDTTGNSARQEAGFQRHQLMDQDIREPLVLLAPLPSPPSRSPLSMTTYFFHETIPIYISFLLYFKNFLK